MNRLLPGASVLLLVIGLVSCDRGEPGHNFRTFRENGVQIAENTGGPRHSTDPFQYEHLISLRGDPAVEESLLHRPGNWTTCDDGYYYVLDRGDNRVAVFNPAGEYERSFGREGRGPGEFISMRLQSLRDGNISIFDSSQMRTTRYRTDGTLIEVITLGSGVRIRDLDRTTEGTLIAWGRRSSLRDEIRYESIILTHLTADGTDTLATVTGGEVGSWGEADISTTTSRRSILQYNIPFSATPSAVYIPDGRLLLTDGTTPDLQLYDLTGKLVKEIRLGITLHPVTDEMRRDYTSSARGPQGLSQPDWKFPEHIGLWNGVHADDSGFIWLRAMAASIARPESPGSVMHVVAPDGEYLGITELPCRIEGFARELLLGYETEEETGERIPVVYRINPAVGGLRYPR